MTTKKMGLILIAVNAFCFVALVVFLAYRYYLLDWGGALYRVPELKKIYVELVKHKKETGKFPENLNSLVRYDPNNYMLSFGSQRLRRYYPSDDNNPDLDRIIRYQVINEQPVLIDLGSDAKEGGLDGSIDVAYPWKYQKHFPFSTFMTTKFFWVASLWGILMSATVSIPLYLEWRKNPSAAKSVRSIVLAVVLSILLILFEFVVAFFIIGMHVYPHH